MKARIIKPASQKIFANRFRLSGTGNLAQGPHRASWSQSPESPQDACPISSLDSFAGPISDKPPRAGLIPAVPRAGLRGFTLVELLVVLAMGALLTLITATSLGHSQTSTDRNVCLSNLRQLSLAWQMYADDYSGSCMANPATVSSSYLNWARGVLDYNVANADNFNTSYLTNPVSAAMGLYVRSPTLFRCPADLITLNRSGVPSLRVRSYSMNGYVGQGASAYSAGYQVMTSTTQLGHPERTFILLEEHSDSINDGSFFVDVQMTSAAARFVDIPAAFHSGGANLAMGDGHAEYWQWMDPRTMPPVTMGMVVPATSPNNPDVARLQKAASFRP